MGIFMLDNGRIRSNMAWENYTGQMGHSIMVILRMINKMVLECFTLLRERFMYKVKVMNSSGSGLTDFFMVKENSIIKMDLFMRDNGARIKLIQVSEMN